MLNQRGQESAPFELLIAVIVMTFVVILGTVALNELSEQKCKGEITGAMESFATAIETVATGKGKYSVNFNPPLCFGEKNTIISIVEMDNPEICAYYCGGGQQLCTLLRYDAVGKYSYWKCLHISPNTVFETNAGGCPDEDVADNYYAVDLRTPGINYNDTIPRGNYIITGKFHAMSAFPRLCAYHFENR